MTLQEFFREARRGRKWEVVHDWFKPNGAVRCDDGYCPLGAVMLTMGGWPTHSPSISYAAERLGLHPAKAMKIAFAADNHNNKHRRWLLKNLGVRA